MKRILYFILFAFLSLQLTTTARATDFKINEIGIGSTYADVVGKFGKPVSSKTGGIVPCSEGSTLLTLNYRGLEILLSKDPDERSFKVYSIRASASKWSVLGIKMGAPMITVKARFGKPYNQTKESGLLGLHFNNDFGRSGSASFYFKGDRLSKVDLYLNYC